MTNHTNPEAAAGRLRRCQQGETVEQVYGCLEPHVAYLTDSLVLKDACLRETDPTLIDEAFARSVAVEVVDEPNDGRMWKAIAVCGDSRQVRLHIPHYPADGCCLYVFRGRVLLATIERVTIGDVYTACRLFKVNMKDRG